MEDKLRTCNKCGAQKSAKKAPPGWRDVAGKLLCGKCFKDSYVTRAAEFPLGTILGVERKAPGKKGTIRTPADTWERFYLALAGQPVPRAGQDHQEEHGQEAHAEWLRLFDQALLESWRHTTCLADWGVQMLMQADVPPDPFHKGVLPKLELDLYKLGFTQRRYPGRDWWEGNCQGANSVLRLAKSQYMEHRQESRQRFTDSPPWFKLGVPYPVHAGQWQLTLLDGRPTICLPLAGMKFLIQLRSGPEFARQMAQVKQILSGDAEKRELSLRGKIVSSESRCRGRRVLTIRKPGGGRRRELRAMVKIVGVFPRKPQSQDLGSMLLTLDPNAFCVAQVDGRQPWILNADHVKRRVARHREYLQRISEDLKYEKRWPKQKREQINESREDRCRKQHNFLDSWVEQAAVLVANYAARCRVGVVVYSPTDRGYLESFPWFAFGQRLAVVLEDRGIQLVAAPEEEAG